MTWTTSTIAELEARGDWNGLHERLRAELGLRSLSASLTLGETMVRLALDALEDAYPSHPSAVWVRAALSGADPGGPPPKDPRVGGANNLTSAAEIVVRLHGHDRDAAQTFPRLDDAVALVGHSIQSLSMTAWAQCYPDQWSLYCADVDAGMQGSRSPRSISVALRLRQPKVRLAVRWAWRLVAAYLAATERTAPAPTLASRVPSD